MSQMFKKCPQCQRIYAVNDLFCEDCGLKLIEEQIPSPVNDPDQAGMYPPPAAPSFQSTHDFQPEQHIQPAQGSAAKQKMSGLLIAAIVLLVLLLLAIALLIFLLFRNGSKESSDTLESGGNSIITLVPDSTETEGESAAESSDDGFGFIENEQSEAGQPEEIPVEVQTEAPTSPPTEAPTEAPAESRFEVVANACSWSDAYTKCVEAGGHLAYIQSDEDLAKILEAANASGLKFLWLGGTTAISPDNSGVIPSWLNGNSFDYVNQAGLWYAGEPSGRDYTDPDLPYEPYVMLWKVDDKWSLNDNSDAILEYYRAENIGYVCQYD
ncbi:MAG: C-type lectin domain-containing protein [Ruminococcus sp.]|nr:C-type lectin domain-containing protein [Ruminococcus sp.]